MKTKHHIIPRSRGGNCDKENVQVVVDFYHDLYHRLFKNKTPNEIVEYLNTTFWKNNYQIEIIKRR